NSSVNSLTSPGERRAVTPRKYKPIFFVRCKSCRSLPCPAGIARVRRPRRVVFSRRLRPCPRKASARIDPRRQQKHTYWQNNMLLLHSLHQLRSIKSNKTYEKSSKKRSGLCNPDLFVSYLEALIKISNPLRSFS